MANCKITSGITRDCKKYMSGVIDVVIGNYNEVDDITFSTSPANLGEVTQIDMLIATPGTPGIPYKAFKLEVNPQSGGATSENEQDIPSQLNVHTNVFTGRITNDDPATLAILKTYVESDLFVLYNTASGPWRGIGLPYNAEGTMCHPAYCTVSWSSGTSPNDTDRGYVITLTAMASEMPVYVDKDAVAAII